MPKGPRGERRPANVVGATVLIARISIGEAEEKLPGTRRAEGHFSVFKRGLVGTYHIMSEHHLQRYLNEFNFRMSNRAKLGVNDDIRTERAIKGVEGKRLTYHQPHSA